MFSPGVEQIRWVRLFLLANRTLFLRYIKGVIIGRRVVISLGARLVFQRRGAIRIGDDSLIAFKTLIITTSEADGIERPVMIGARTFVGGGAVIGPGVVIGDDCIIGAGSVVFTSVPAGSMIAGNPASIIRTGLTIRRSRGEFLFT